MPAYYPSYITTIAVTIVDVNVWLSRPFPFPPLFAIMSVIYAVFSFHVFIMFLDSCHLVTYVIVIYLSLWASASPQTSFFRRVAVVFFLSSFLRQCVIFHIPGYSFFFSFFFSISSFFFFRDVRVRRGEVCKRQNIAVAHGGTDMSHEQWSLYALLD